jgi:tRNA nucleotidyltransferase (CCA-adding enzyme)
LQIYVVGGAVRDQLLGKPVFDRDYVVVGATQEEMIELGYQAVGRDFPVFLHPTTHEEYALARTERKTAPGYAGFVFHADPSVTLEEDLLRRDLTINAMAQTLDGATLIDPCGGRQDLEGRWFRHVGPAFVEDPVRLLRVARFAARFPDFRLAPETHALLVAMVDNGEVDALVAERVWAELARGLIAEQPSSMIALLADVTALARVAPGAPTSAAALLALDAAASSALPLSSRVAVWLVAGGLDADQIKALCERLKTPVEVRDCSVSLCFMTEAFTAAPEPNPKQVLYLLEGSDALRRSERFCLLLDVLSLVRPNDDAVLAWQDCVRRGLEVIRSVDTKAVAEAARGGDIGQAMRAAKLAALQHAMVDPTAERRSK